MEERTQLQALQLAAIEPEAFPDLQREVGDPPRVIRRVLVVGLERVRQRLHGLQEGRLERLEACRVRQSQLRLMRDPAEQVQVPLRESALARDPDRDASEPST